MDTSDTPLVAAYETTAGGRSENQDRHCVRALDPSRNLWGFRAVVVVADGMGGHAKGAAAAQLAVDTAAEVLAAVPEDHEKFDTEFLGAEAEEVVRRVFHTANERIYESAAEDNLQGNMGTTMTALVVTEEQVVVGHVGDSKAFIVSEAGIEQITQDHSWVAEQVREGLMTPEEAADSPLRSHLTQAIGVEIDVHPDIRRIPLKTSAMLIACSDGLTEVVDGEAIRKVVAAEGSPQQVCQTLVSMAMDGGTRDNVTVGAVSIGSVATEHEPTAAAPPDTVQEEAAPSTPQAEAPDASEPEEDPALPTATEDGEGESTVGGQRSQRLAILAATCMFSLVVGLFAGKLLVGLRSGPPPETEDVGLVSAAGEGAVVEPAPGQATETPDEDPGAAPTTPEAAVGPFSLEVRCEEDLLIVSGTEAVTYDVYPRGQHTDPDARLDPLEGSTAAEARFRLPEAPSVGWHDESVSLTIERLGEGKITIRPTPDDLDVFVDHRARSGADLESAEVEGREARIGFYFPPGGGTDAYAVAIADFDVEREDVDEED